MHFDGRDTKVMIVDNDRTTLEMVQIRLDVAGYHPIPVRTAQTALEMLRHTRPDAMILERDMPFMDGLALLHSLGEAFERRPIPILLVGRNLAVDDVRRAMRLGVRDCLAKPFSGATVLERVSRMLRKPAPAPLPVVRLSA